MIYSSCLLACLSSALILSFGSATTARTCSGRRFPEGDSIVCVCNSTYCDDLPAVNLQDTPVGSYVSYRSSQVGDRFVRTLGRFTEQKPGSVAGKNYRTPDVVFRISRSGSYQNIIGFGGAFTDSAALNIFNLSESTQKNLLQSYFSENGSQYSVGRVPMASCDFSTRVYSYADSENDFDLVNFNLAKEDVNLKIPLIRKAGDIAGQPLTIFASPWSAPAWMKTNGQMFGRGFLKGTSGDKYHKTWAKYFVKFVQQYEAHHVAIWGLTAQNEPIDGYIPDFPFQSMGFSPASQRDFIANDLGPALQEAGLRRVKLMIMDDLRSLLPEWADTILVDANATQYVDGIAVHWYADQVSSPSDLSKTNSRHPDKFLLSTEACQGSKPWETKVILGDWGRAESYAQDIFENLQNWVAGWIDWNLALNLQGGPNWVNNFVDSPIIVNASADVFYKQPMYYSLAHFSKFIVPKSVIIKAQSSMPDQEDSRSSSGLEFIAAQRPDGGVVVVVMNRGGTDVSLKVADGRLKRGTFVETITARSIQSFVWW